MDVLFVGGKPKKEDTFLAVTFATVAAVSSSYTVEALITKERWTLVNAW